MRFKSRLSYAILFIGLLTSPIFLLSHCNNITDANYTINTTTDSISRLFPGDIMIPKSSFNKKLSLVCYYSKSVNKIYFKSENKNGSFNLPSKGEIVTFYPHNLDTIFLVFSDSVLIVNSKGRLIKSIKYSKNIVHKNIPYRICNTVNSFPTLAYDEEKAILYLPCYNFQTNWWDKDFYNYSMLIVGLNIAKENVIFFPSIKYPSEYVNNCYAESFIFYYTLKNKSIYMSFNAIPDLYKFDMQKQNTKASKLELPDLKKVPFFDSTFNEDLNMVLEYNKKITTYGDIIYDPFKNLFYRFNSQPTIHPKQKSRSSYWSNFDIILSVYDENFNEMKKINFGDSVNHSETFITSRGLHIKMYQPSQKYEYFKIISVQN